MVKYIDEYRNPEWCRQLLMQIEQIVDRPVRLMEVCGTHTMAIARNGIRAMLPGDITLLSGPGCPVCVTAQEEIDRCLALAEQENVIITTFGDLMRVPGSDTSLQQQRAHGADVRVVYSPLNCLEIARDNPDREVVFLGVGFETTAPAVAATILQAAVRHIDNFSVLSMHKVVPPALHALMQHPDVRVDGFILPGHVSVIIGARAYRNIADQYEVACVIAGFEPVDILDCIRRLLAQIRNGRAAVEIAYGRAVTVDGNARARAVMEQVFKPSDAMWRGIGVIPGSGLILREKYRDYDAAQRFTLSIDSKPEVSGCRCGDILIGKRTPPECPLFAVSCIPQHPVGPCMVSSEGTCAAYYRYLR